MNARNRMGRKTGPIRSLGGAFTLIELLTVIAVFSVLLTLSALSVGGSLDNYRLSSTAAQVQSDLAYASQYAAKTNASVYFRFYRYRSDRDGRDGSHFRAYQLLQLDPASGTVVPLRKVRYFEEGVVVFPDPRFSNILDRGIQRPDESDPPIPIGFRSGETRSLAYEFCELRLNPDGSTSLEKDRAWSLCLVLENNTEASHPPESARILVINSITGAVRIY